jgi:hypothetical protein
MEDYYKTEFLLHYHMKYNRTEIEEMMPFERDVLIGLYNKQKEEEKKSVDDEMNSINSKYKIK